MRNVRKLSLSVMLMIAANLCGAEQRKEARDGDTIEAQISDRAPTRIRVAGAKIVDVVGHIQSVTNCETGSPDKQGQVSRSNTNGEGSLILNCDVRKGEVYIQPVEAKQLGKRAAAQRPIDLFISTSRATYTLSLTTASAPADSIVLVDKSPALGDGVGEKAGKTPDHVRTLKAMLRALTSNRPPSDLQVTEVNELRPLWTEAEFRLRRTLQGRGLIGESFLLRNTSDATMVIAEQELDSDGVVAVSVENLNLRPGDTTWVHIIRAGE